jgi:predicted phosphate transport protein (TIGR00153 family)
MFGRLASRESKFFDLFSESADLIVKAAVEFRTMLEDLSKSESHSKIIKDLEHQADEITHRTIEQLHKTFITPLDREDIHKLITELDDILDFIEAASQRIVLYDIRKVTPETKALADVCVQSANLVQKAVHGLSNLKNVDHLIKSCVEINRLENEADHLLRSGMAKLFREEPDTRQLIKMKEIYELLETVTDRCEDVANVIDGIVLEYA